MTMRRHSTNSPTSSLGGGGRLPTNVMQVSKPHDLGAKAHCWPRSHGGEGGGGGFERGISEADRPLREVGFDGASPQDQRPISATPQ